MAAQIIGVRPARDDEAAAISRCLKAAFESFRGQYTSGAFEDTVLSEPAVKERMHWMTVYVALDGESVIGTVAVAAAGFEGHLRGMAVFPEWQGKRVAEQLLVKAEQDLFARGCTHITLDTTIPLRRAMRFYQKHGFVLSGKSSDFFGMPLHELVKSSPQFEVHDRPKRN